MRNDWPAKPATFTMHGQTLRQMRMEIGWTQNTAAEVLEITRSSLAHYETGRAAVPHIVVRKINILHRGITKTIEVSRRI